MKLIPLTLFAAFTALLLPVGGRAQVNSGSDGHDGAFNPTSSVVIDMADHPDGVYQYTSVNIPTGVTVSFIPNPGNKPVVWLVQGNCLIDGAVDVSGKAYGGTTDGAGGPGGWRGGSGGATPSAGQGPGGSAQTIGQAPGAGSYGTQGQAGFQNSQGLPGPIYGNSFLLPLMGGSGAGGTNQTSGGGGGGGGALLIASSATVAINGQILARGGFGYSGGSGGGVRIVSTKLSGAGIVDANGSTGLNYPNGGYGGVGRIRFDTYENTFRGGITGVITTGFQPIIIPAAGQGIQLAIQSLAGTAVPASPSGGLATPDVIIPAQQANPIPVVVRCTNIPLNTAISVVVHPANGADVQAVGVNDTGTVASSTATLSLNMPRGGGIIYARAVTGIVGTASAASPISSKTPSIAETGWTAGGERFVKLEITAALGGKQSVAYITESGKRYPAN